MLSASASDPSQINGEQWTVNGKKWCCSMKEHTLKVISHWVWNVRMRFSVFPILSYQIACYRCENTENRTWSECFFDGWKFWRQCVNMIDTTRGGIYFSTCGNFGRKCRTHLQTPLQSTAVFCCCSGVRKACVLPVDSLHLFLLCLRPVSPQNSFQRLY